MFTKEKLQSLVYTIFDPLVRLIRTVGLTPNHITSIGFLINILGAIFLVYPVFNDGIPSVFRLVGFGFIILFAGLMDMLDGRMARIYNLHSTYGAFYDSVIDRYSELVMFLGLMGFFMIHDYWLLVLISFCGLAGSLMVSYSRARAEGLGLDCSVGLLQRPERIIMVCLTCITAGFFDPIISERILLVGLGIVAILANFTASQRVTHVKKLLSATEPNK